MVPHVPRPAADRCPGLLRPHRAEDGPLVRIRIPGGQTDGPTLVALSELSSRFANGDLQLTSRGNVQLRGVDEGQLAALSGAVSRLGLFPSPEHDRVRNVVASPLTGLGQDQPDLRDLIRELDRRICANALLAHLPGRFLFAVDSGRGDVLSAGDVGYLATGEDRGFVVAGDRGYPVARDAAGYELIQLAERFLAARSTLGRPLWHVRELPWPLLPEHPVRAWPVGAPVRLGPVGEAASVTVPLATLTGEQVAVLGRLADAVVVTPWHGLVLPGAAGRLAELTAAGLVADPAAPWSALSACVGAPNCAKAEIDTHALAHALVQDWPAPRLPVHISGCRRRCGAPRGRYVDLVAPPSLTDARALVAAHGPTQDPYELARPSRRYDYVRDGAEIYARSFAAIRKEAQLASLPAGLVPVAVRMIHAAGDVHLVRDLDAHPRLVEAAHAALAGHATIFTDSEMLAAGITRRRLPADNPVRCLLNDPRTVELARRWGTTRSAAAVSLWGDALEGAVVAVGNAPTALFHLLELIADGGPRPAAVVGIPVGFVGSAESKLALARNAWDLPYLVVHGRRGGSALCAAAVNALADPSER